MLAHRIFIGVVLSTVVATVSSAQESNWLHAKGKRKIYCPFAFSGSTSFLWTGKLDGNGLATGSGMLRVTTDLNEQKMQFSLVGDFRHGKAVNDIVILNSDGAALIATTKNGVIESVNHVARNSASASQTHAVGYRPNDSQPSKLLSTLQSTVKDLEPVTDAVKQGAELYRQFKPPAPPQPETRLYVKSVTAKSTKSSGAGWDNGNGEPDLKVIVKKGFLGSSVETGVARQNALKASYSNAFMAVESGDEITIRVMDQDFLDDDLVGYKTLKITSTMIDEGKLVLSFGQVEALHLEFKE